MDPQQRARLLAARLKTIVEKTAGPSDRRSLAVPGGAALAGDDGTWVLADAEPHRSLGPALAVARRHNPGPPVHVVVEQDAGLLARRASCFAEPPAVWFVVGRSVERAEPEPLVPDPPLDPRVAPFADLLTAAGERERPPVALNGGRLDDNLELGADQCCPALRREGYFLPLRSPYRRWNRSTRPPESTRRCLPVKNGWQTLQSSTRSESEVERVSNVLPQEQVTETVSYLGWMSVFMAPPILRVSYDFAASARNSALVLNCFMPSSRRSRAGPL